MLLLFLLPERYILHSNPSLAADLLHLFEKIENKQIFSGDLHTHATPLTNNNSQKSDGYTFTLSETYCDTQNFYVSVQITSEEGFQKANEHKWIQMVFLPFI